MGTARDIKERTFDFAVKILDLADHLPDGRKGHTVADQLILAGTSVGANVEEAAAASSKEDFVYRMNISLREARESNFWLRIISARKMVADQQLGEIVSESEELKKILGAIVSSARGTRK